MFNLIVVKRAVSAVAASILSIFQLYTKEPVRQNVTENQPVLVEKTQATTTKHIAKKAPKINMISMKEHTYVFAGKIDNMMDATDVKVMLEAEGMGEVVKKVVADQEGTYILRMTVKAPVSGTLKWTLTAGSLKVSGQENLATNKVAIENMMDMNRRVVSTQRIIA